MVHLTRRGLLAGSAALAGCAEQGGEEPIASSLNSPGPTGLVLFSLDFVAGQRTGLPNRSQVSLVEAGQNGRIARTLAGPGRLSGSDAAVPDVSLCRVFALNLPARPLAVGRVFVEPTEQLTLRNTFLLAPLVFTPSPGRALYLGNVAILPHTWAPTREPHITPSSHRALRDTWARDEPLLRLAAPQLAGMPVDKLERPSQWPPALPPRQAWPDLMREGRPVGDGTTPPYYGPPGQPLAPPGSRVRNILEPAPPPGFGPPGVAPGRFGRGAAQ